jgi:hypothetical protein
MNIRIDQSAGFGDIFFCQKIGRRLIELGHTVYWPIFHGYSYVSQYIPEFRWCEPPANEGFENLNLGQASILIGWDDPSDIDDKVMESKYDYANTLYDIGDYSDWPDYLKINRYHDKEKLLSDKVLKNVPDEFCVINRHFATECLFLEEEIKSDLPIVEINKLPGFTLFDWCGVLEKATEIRIPDSSFPYLVEMLDTTDDLYMYNRTGEPYIRTKKIWKKKWRFMDS